MITQQPGSIGKEILSQGDNWFIFHLLSAVDLLSVRSANAHFSDDLLSGLLNEPIPGQGLFWSSVAGKPYPVPLRVLSFEQQQRPLDRAYSRPALRTYAAELRAQFLHEVQGLVSEMAQVAPLLTLAEEGLTTPADRALDPSAALGVDVFALHKRKATEALRTNAKFELSLNQRGIPWGVVVGILSSALPPTVEDRDNVAHGFLREAVSTVLGGDQGIAWDTEKRPTRDGRMVTFIFKKSV
jgi:hypothetical protein